MELYENCRTQFQAGDYLYMSADKREFKFTRPSEDEIKSWWNWYSRIPLEKNHPCTVGGEIDQNQYSDSRTQNIFCVSGIGESGGTDPNRKIGIKEGIDLLIPIINAAFSRVEFPRLDERQLLQQARQETKVAQNLNLTIDGMAVLTDTNKESLYIETTEPFPLRYPNACTRGRNDINAGDYDTVSAGYWCKLSLPRREQHYTVRFGGSCNIYIDNKIVPFTTDTTYRVTVN
jgi:hypothetical protein